MLKESGCVLVICCVTIDEVYPPFAEVRRSFPSQQRAVCFWGVENAPVDGRIFVQTG